MSFKLEILEIDDLSHRLCIQHSTITLSRREQVAIPVLLYPCICYLFAAIIFPSKRQGKVRVTESEDCAEVMLQIKIKKETKI